MADSRLSQRPTGGRVLLRHACQHRSSMLRLDDRQPHVLRLHFIHSYTILRVSMGHAVNTKTD